MVGSNYGSFSVIVKQVQLSELETKKIQPQRAFGSQVFIMYVNNVKLKHI
jgi:hypothetical protein